MQPYILVMEDEDALATLLQYNLEKEGYDVAVAADGEEGMLQIDERMPRPPPPALALIISG